MNALRLEPMARRAVHRGVVPIAALSPSLRCPHRCVVPMSPQATAISTLRIWRRSSAACGATSMGMSRRTNRSWRSSSRRAQLPTPRVSCLSLHAYRFTPIASRPSLHALCRMPHATPPHASHVHRHAPSAFTCPRTLQALPNHNRVSFVLTDATCAGLSRGQSYACSRVVPQLEHICRCACPFVSLFVGSSLCCLHRALPVPVSTPARFWYVPNHQ